MLQKKEKEEAKALEEMVQKVEANLVTSTVSLLHDYCTCVSVVFVCVHNMYVFVCVHNMYVFVCVCLYNYVCLCMYVM